MKRFIFSTEVIKVSKTYGYRRIKARIYQIKRDRIEFLGYTEWNTDSFRGELSEVNEWLLENKYIPKSWSKGYEWQEIHKSRGVTYTPYYNTNEKYEIKEI